jgi:hypothetical protein
MVHSTHSTMAHSTPQGFRVYCLDLPLALYYEVAAHLRQVKTVTIEVLPQQSTDFDYLQSQVGGLEIRYDADATDTDRARVQQILAYYSDRYGEWQSLDA